MDTMDQQQASTEDKEAHQPEHPEQTEQSQQQQQHQQQQTQQPQNQQQQLSHNPTFDNMSTLNSYIYDNEFTINELKSFALEYVKQIVSRASELAAERAEARHTLASNNNNNTTTADKQSTLFGTSSDIIKRSTSSYSNKKHRTWMHWSVLLSCCMPESSGDATNPRPSD